MRKMMFALGIPRDWWLYLLFCVGGDRLGVFLWRARLMGWRIGELYPRHFEWDIKRRAARDAA